MYENNYPNSYNHDAPSSDSVNGYSQGSGGHGQGGQTPSYGPQSRSSHPTYPRVRNLINAGDLGGAERLLFEVQQRDRLCCQYTLTIRGRD